MKAQRGTIKQLISKNGLLDDKEIFHGTDPIQLRRSVAIIPIVCGGFDWEYEAEEEVRSEVLKSAEGVKLRAETWREFFQQVDTSGYSKVYLDHEGIAKLSIPAQRIAPMTAEERVCKEEHKQLSKLAKEKGHTTPLKMWEENHWKDGRGRWHKENNDDWDAETGIGERLPEIYAEQMETEVTYKAGVWEEKQLATALNFKAMSVSKLMELEADRPALHNEFKEYLHAQTNEWVEKTFWAEYESVKAGEEAEF